MNQNHNTNNSDSLPQCENHWGKIPDNQFGYSNEEERHAKRGLEDWELADSIKASQSHFPKWLVHFTIISIICAVSFIVYYKLTHFGQVNSWVSDSISIELLVFFILCVTMLILALINFIQQTPKTKKGEKFIFIGVIISIFFAIVFGILQLFILGHQI